MTAMKSCTAFPDTCSFPPPPAHDESRGGVETVLAGKLDTTIEAQNRIPVDVQGSCVYQRAQQSVGIACDTQRDLKESGIVLAAREPQGNGEVDQ